MSQWSKGRSEINAIQSNIERKQIAAQCFHRENYFCTRQEIKNSEEHPEIETVTNHTVATVSPSYFLFLPATAQKCNKCAE